MIRTIINNRHRSVSLKTLTSNKYFQNKFTRFQSSFEKFPKNVGLYNKQLEKDSCGVGLVAQMKREASRQIVLDANQMLVRMSHRGGCGCEPNTGDGAGILLGMPHSYYRKVLQEESGIELGPLNSFGTGIIFMPKADEKSYVAIKSMFEEQVNQCGYRVIAWRAVETGA
jgi:glutamate synthase domain-containing protein 1